MTRTGSRRAARALPLLLVLLAVPAARAEEPQLAQEADRAELGTEDVLQLTVLVVNPPRGSRVHLPASEDFETLSTSQGTQRSLSWGGGAAVMQEQRRYTLLLRPLRAGALTIPPAKLELADGRVLEAEETRVRVRQGTVDDPRAQRGRRDPLRDMLPPGWRDPLGEDDDQGPDAAPRGEQDLFLRASLDRNEVWAGEQVTLSLYIYSRVDLSSVDAVTMPKLEGFWSEDLESPTQLSGEQKFVNGLPYRAYLLRRRALFPVKPGALAISPAEADITTGFLWAGHRVHRVANPLKLKVKPLPPGAPRGFNPAHVGAWRLSVEANPQRVELGQPVTVRVTLEGVGNVKNLTPPALTAPPALKVYEPTTSDTLLPSKSRLQGRRVQEYLVMPQRTGTFTLPGLSFPFFEPRSGEYQVAQSEPITVTVEPGGAGAGAVAGAPPAGGVRPQPPPDGAKNVLVAGGLRPPRHRVAFESPAPPVWARPFYVPLLLAPPLAWGLVALGSLVRRRLATRGPGAGRPDAREVRRRLERARALVAGADVAGFYAELERAVLGGVEARLGAPVVGLTRVQLADALAARGVGEARRARVLAVLEACDVGRYAPGAAGGERERVLAEAEAALAGGEDT